MKKKSGFIITLFVIAVVNACLAQYPPAPGNAGTTAIHKDSSVFYAWATACNVNRGFVNISDTNFVYNNSNHASYGNVYMATGIPDGLVLSLGDGGSAILTFDTVITDHAGWDFAVFENSFSNGFLELAFVEASSDGVHFVRFPAVSLTPTTQQVGTFDTLDTRKIHNLAGKYRLEYGTPFDLNDLRDSAGIDIFHVTHIRLVDVVGSVQDAWATFDSQNHKVNDPWPTPFDTGGFDLDGVGLVHNAPASAGHEASLPVVGIQPNPCRDKVQFFSSDARPLQVEITDANGHLLTSSEFTISTVLDVSDIPTGFYFVTFIQPGTSSRFTKKLLKY